MFIDEEMLVEILNKLDDSMDEIVAKQDFKDWNEMENFLSGQYDSSLAKSLHSKSSSIDDLEPAKKTMIGERKKRLFTHLEQTFKKSSES